jgi:hypothetical protein
MRPFDLLRACFLLLAVVIIVEMLFTVVGGLGCMYLNLLTVRQIGACLPIIEQIREQWAEVLTAILALLLAYNRPHPPKE